MESVVVVIHVFIACALVGLILLQKNEGGASGAGVGGGVSAESMMRPRARPNPLGRATAILGLCFFATSLTLAVMSKPNNRQNTSIMAEPTAHGGPSVPKVDETPSVPTVPSEPSTPAAPAAPSAPSSSDGPAVPNK